MNRKSLLRQAAEAAVELRDDLDLDQMAPTDPYAAAAALGIKVVFLDASMEGFYFKGSPPRVLLSALRPVARRAFTCAHEIGHHRYGHGSTIDKLQADDLDDTTNPAEILANGFAAFFLMPSVGIRGAFFRRGWKASDATPEQLFTIACEYGVGYATLLNHLSYALGDVGDVKRAELARVTPQKIRRSLVGDEFDALLIIDAQSQASTYDAEQATAVLVPKGTVMTGGALTFLGATPHFDLYQAAKRGVAKISIGGRLCEVRVMPKAMVWTPPDGI